MTSVPAAAPPRPILPMQNEEPAADSARRDQILAAARAALTKVGFEKITTRRIAEEAGVNIATLHYHFGSKEALLTEVVRDVARRIAGILRESMAGADEAADALERVFEATWHVVRERPGVLRYDLAVRGFRDQAARRDALAIYDGYKAILEDIADRHVAAGGRLAAGLTPSQFGEYVLSAADGVILQHVLSGDDAAARRGLDLTKAYALQLLGLAPTTDDRANDR